MSNLDAATLQSEPLDPQRLQQADVLLVNGMEVAIAISYQMGQTPMVVTRARGKNAEDLIWLALEQQVPVLELAGLDPTHVDRFTPGSEIPEDYYRPVAHALALLHKQNGADPVRFVKLPPRRPRQLSKRARALVESFGSVLDIPRLFIELAADAESLREMLENRLGAFRQRVALELGLPLEPIPLQLTPRLENGAYQIVLRDEGVAGGHLQVMPEVREELVLPLMARLKHLVALRGWELLSYDQVEALLARARKNSPGLYKQLFPRHFTVSAMRQVLRNLLREQLSIRDLTVILEIIHEHLPFTKDADLLSELVRTSYGRSLSRRYQDANGFLNVLTLASGMEHDFLAALREAAGVRWLEAPPDVVLRFLQAVDMARRTAAEFQVQPVLLVTPMLRRFLARIVGGVYPEIPVLAYNEIAALTDVRAVGSIGAAGLGAATPEA
ncbi:MAG: FHIPEP family type III secretion protein [Candidatus Xenobia bacterium]